MLLKLGRCQFFYRFKLGGIFFCFFSFLYGCGSALRWLCSVSSKAWRIFPLRRSIICPAGYRINRQTEIVNFGRLMVFSVLAKLMLLSAARLPLWPLLELFERLGKEFSRFAAWCLVADVAAEANRGYAFGLHKAMDQSRRDFWAARCLFLFC